jgi:hypothetical protein
VILFSTFLVVVAVGLLVAGVVTSKLVLVYAAIGASGLALLALGAGAVVNWRALFGKPKTAASDVGLQEPVPAQAAGAQAAPAQPGPQSYSRPSAAGPVWEPAADSHWEPAAARPAEAASATGRSRPADEAALWESAVPPTGTFPRVQPAAQAPATRPAEQPPASPSGTGQAAAPDEPPVPVSAAASPAAEAPPSPTLAPPVPATASALPRTPEPGPAAAQPAATLGDSTPPAAGSRSAAEGAPASAPPETAPKPAEPETAAGPSESAGVPSVATPDHGPDPRTVVTVVPGVPRYHNASCLLIRFMGEDDLEKTTLAAAREAGCTPCRACLRDQRGKAPE